MEKVYLKFGLGVNANETIPEINKKSVEAERLGIDYVWVSDVPVQRYAPVVASAIATNTKKIRIGLGLLSPFLHAPTQIANSFTTLVEAYGERFELCIGPGDRNQLERVGVSLSHSIGIRNYLLNAKNQIENTLRKNRIKTRIWLGAQGPKMLEIAKFFDGVLLNYSQPNLIKWAINNIGIVKKKTFQFGVYAPSYVYRGIDLNIYNLLRISAAVVALGAPKTILKQLSLYEKIRELKAKLDAGVIIESIINEIPQQTVELFSVFKSSTELEPYLSDLSKIRIRHVVFGYPQNFSDKTIWELAQALKDYTREYPNYR